ncbi:MAG: ABC transporter ATP-binding protein [Victivallaceae bacterium]
MNTKVSDCWTLIKPYRKLLVGAILSVMMFSNLGLALPFMLKIAIDKVLPNQDFQLYMILCGGMILIALSRCMLRYLWSYLINYVQMRVLIDVRHKLFKHLQTLSLRFYQEYRTGKLISNVISDVGQLQQLIGITAQLCDQMFLILVIVIILIVMNFQMSLVALIIIPLHFINLRHSHKIARVDTKAMQEKMSEISANLAETLNGVKVVKSFSKERTECRDFFISLRPTLDIHLRAHTQWTLCWNIADVISMCAYLAIIGIGTIMAQKGSMTIGDFAAYYTYMGMLLGPINALSAVSANITTGLVSAERITKLLNTTSEIKEDPHPVRVEHLNGNIEFKNVTFGYDEQRPVLKDFSLKIEPGQKVALVGPSGSGKSTVSSLLLRFYDISTGEIRVDGINIKKLGIESYRNSIGVVLQEPFLFSGSIKDNIAYAKKGASDEEVKNAAVMANVEEFVTHLDQRYETIIGENGASLSGGQKQRLAIARAVLKNPSILVLDEATSALDTVSEHLVQQALDRLMQDKTTVIIAHRLSTIKNADLIVVLNEGRIVQQGKHDELLAQEGIYKEMYFSQKKTVESI